MFAVELTPRVVTFAFVAVRFPVVRLAVMVASDAAREAVETVVE